MRMKASCISDLLGTTPSRWQFWGTIIALEGFSQWYSQLPAFRQPNTDMTENKNPFPLLQIARKEPCVLSFSSSKIRLFFGSLSNVCFLKFMVFYFPHSAVQVEFNNQWTWYSMNNQFLFILWVQLGQGSIMPRVSGSQFWSDTLTSKYKSNVQIKAERISSSFYFSSWVFYFLPLLSMFLVTHKLQILGLLLTSFPLCKPSPNLWAKPRREMSLWYCENDLNWEGEKTHLGKK